MRNFSDAVIFVNSTLILDSQTISFGNEQSDNYVHNLLDGFAGISIGTSVFKASCESAVPREGMPLRLDKLAQDREVVEVQIFVGDMSITSKGYVQNPKYSKGLDNAMSCSFEFIGTPAELE